MRSVESRSARVLVTDKNSDNVARSPNVVAAEKTRITSGRRYQMKCMWRAYPTVNDIESRESAARAEDTYGIRHTEKRETNIRRPWRDGQSRFIDHWKTNTITKIIVLVIMIN
jgi:hypothetical protein